MDEWEFDRWKSRRANLSVQHCTPFDSGDCVASDDNNDEVYDDLKQQRPTQSIPVVFDTAE